VRTAIANNACKFHEDRLNDGVTIYFIVVKPRAAMELGPVFAITGALQRSILTVKYLRRSACVWTAVRSVYGQPKSKNGNIFQA